MQNSLWAIYYSQRNLKQNIIHIVLYAAAKEKRYKRENTESKSAEISANQNYAYKRIHIQLSISCKSIIAL